MSATSDQVKADNQAGTNSDRHPIQDYADAGMTVVNTIAERGATHGDPETFGAVFAGLLNAYLPPVLARAGAVTPADAFVVLDLMKSARIAVGGPHPAHFHDKAGYGLLGEVHTARAFAEVERRREAARTAAGGDEAPKAPTDPAEALEDDQDEARAWDPTHPANVPDNLDADDVDDADLLSAALDPARTPMADLLDVEGEPRPGVSAGEVEARRERVRGLLRAEAGQNAGKRFNSERAAALKSAMERFGMIPAAA